MTQPASEILVPSISTAPQPEGLKAGGAPGNCSLAVDRLPATRTAQPHGISGPELDRLAGAVHFTKMHCRGRRGGLWWLTTDRGTARQVIDDIAKRITRLQHEYDLPVYTAVIYEASGGLHAHITFLGCVEIERRRFRCRHQERTRHRSERPGDKVSSKGTNAAGRVWAQSPSRGPAGFA